MILSSADINQLATAAVNPLIDIFRPENLRGSSYDLTVGGEYYVAQEDDGTSVSTIHLRPGQAFSIPPHAVCFILSAESISLPMDVTARVSLRMTNIYAGLVLTSQPPFDPGYSGKVVVLLHNLSSSPFHIKSGDRVATIEFAKLTSPYSGRPHRSVSNLEGQLTKPLVSSLTEISKQSSSAHEKVNWLSGQMMTFAALVVAVLAVPSLFSYNSLVDRLSEQKEQIKELKESLAEYERRLVLAENVASNSLPKPGKNSAPNPEKVNGK